MEVDGISYSLIEFFRDEDGQIARMSYELRHLTRESAKSPG